MQQHEGGLAVVTKNPQTTCPCNQAGQASHASTQLPADYSNP